MTQSDKIGHYAEAIATDFFISMLNPQFRGPAFDYLTFDIENHVEAMIGTGFPKPLTPKEVATARTSARRIWDRWIAQIGEGLPKV